MRLAGVFSHPDDDVYVLGGSLLLHRGELDLALLFATSGEAGPISDASLAERATLGAVREREQRASLEVLGFGCARVEWLRHADYYLPDVPFHHLRDHIETFLSSVRPHVVVTFGPDGLTSHHDHIRVGEATTEAWHRARHADQGGDAAFSTLLYAALRRSDIDRFYAGVRAGGYAYGEEGRLFDVTGVPDASIAISVDTRPVRAAKLAAIRRHRTQRVEHERIPEPLRWIHLDSECFVQAAPPVRHGEPIRSGLLDGLPERESTSAAG